MSSVREIDGHERDPLSLYRESLDVRREIVERFGGAPESLWDIVVSLSRFLLMAVDANQNEEVCEHLREATLILAKMRSFGWVSPKLESAEVWFREFADKLNCESRFGGS